MASFLCSPAPEQTQSTIHNPPLEIFSLRFSILQNTMQFYLLLALSGVISGSAVLAQTVTVYDDNMCSGTITFVRTVTATEPCTDTTFVGTRSVSLTQGAECMLYPSLGCEGRVQLLDRVGCNPVDLSSPVRSYRCIAVDGDDDDDD